MALAGEGVIAIWNDILPEARQDFFEWHNREHIPERVGIPGFRRGRRYTAIRGTPEFFTLYEADTAETLMGVDYLTRLDHPTAWTRRVVKSFRNTSRSITRVAASFGSGAGGVLATLRFDVGDDGAAMRHGLARGLLPDIEGRAGVTGAHLCLTDEAASTIETAERRARDEPTGVPRWVVLIEGCSEAAVEAAGAALSDAALSRHGAAGPIERGLYRLDFTRGKTAWSAA